MRVLFDQGTPSGIAKSLSGHKVTEAIERGWDRISNGELLNVAEAAEFDLLLMRNKYGMPFSGFYISFYVYPATTQYADAGLANLRCCSNGANGVKNGTISYLAPSVPAWRDAPRLTSLGAAER